MALSGSETVSVRRGLDLIFVWKESSYSISDNTSNVKWVMQLTSSNGVYTTSNKSRTWVVNVNGTNYTGQNNIAIAKNSTKNLASGTTVIKHNTDGSKTFSYSFSQQINVDFNDIGFIGTKEGKGSGTLTAIPRKSSFTATNAYIGDSLKPSTITINRASSNFTHTLQYKISGQEKYTTIKQEVTTSYKWTIPESAYNYMSSDKTTTITLRCITYNGSTNLGYNTKTITAKAKAASKITATNAYIGKQSTIRIKKTDTSFTHTIQYKISGQSNYKTIINKTNKDSYEWTVPTSTYNYVPSTEKTVDISVRCITYDKDINLGYKTATFTAVCVKDDCKPILSPKVEDTGGVSIQLTGDGKNKVIKGYNVMEYSINATARYGAKIKSQSISCRGKTATTSKGTLNHVQGNEFEFSATDSRGFTTNQTIKKELIDYLFPTCNLTGEINLVTDKTDTTTATIKLEIKGAWFNGSFGKVSNELKISYRYKTNNGSYDENWTSLTPRTSGNTYSAIASIPNLNYRSFYTIEVQVSDSLSDYGSSIVKTSKITVAAEPIFDYNGDNFNFNVPVKLRSGLWFSDTSSKKEYSLVYQIGDSFTITDDICFSSFISGNKKKILLTIPINRPILGDPAVSISGKLIMRGVNGYLRNANDSSDDNTIITFPTSGNKGNGFTYLAKVDENVGICITLAFTSDLVNATNNTPVTCEISGALTIKLSKKETTI